MNNSTLKKSKKTKPKTQNKKPTKPSRLRKPVSMSVEAWQIALRRDYGRAQNFRLKNLGEQPIFSNFLITNPESKNTYRVAIRGQGLGDNFCSCPDFSINTLGTCKHIEFTLAKLEKKRGAAQAFATGFRPEYSSIYLRYGAQRQVIFKMGSQAPKKLSKLIAQYFDNNSVLRPDSFSAFEKLLKQAQEFGHEVRCYEDVIQFVAQVRDQTRLAERVDEVFPKNKKSSHAPLLKVKPYPYQERGARFLAQAGRALLADDMGLGKTIQAIAASEILAKTVGINRVLIVCPTSLKHQWQQEIQKFTSHHAQVVEGLIKKRQGCYQQDSFFKITNYDVIHRDLDAIHEWSPDLIILDEAQRIKNWKTRTAQSVKKLQSDFAFVLTGTPLENRLEELHSIVEFIDRHHLGPLFRFLHQHQLTDENGKVIGYRDLDKVAKTLKPILLRRHKSQVLKELPERIEKKLFLPMTKQQIGHHEENGSIVARIVNRWKRTKYISEKDQKRLMIALQNMRMACNSTYLLDEETDFGCKADELTTLLLELLEQEETKVVIFSQWLRTHELIIRRLMSKKIDHVFFHGGVPGTKRKDLVKQFKSDPNCRIFLGTDAGGVGLNLQHASVVINMDQPWNPAVLEQRIGRVHRLGQKAPVQVFNFISENTIEHGMLDVLAFKKSLFAGVLDGGQNEVFLGGSKLNKFMESVDQITSRMRDKQNLTGTNQPTTPPQSAEPSTNVTNGANRDPSSHPRQTPSMQENWGSLINAGQTFLKQLSQAIQQGNDSTMTGSTSSPDSQPRANLSRSSLLTRDDTTGEAYFKLPVPKPEVVQKIADVVGALARSMA